MRFHSVSKTVALLTSLAALSCASLVACSGGGGGGGGGADGSAEGSTDSDGGSMPGTDGSTNDGTTTSSDGGVDSGPTVAQITLGQGVMDDGMGNTQPYAYPQVTFIHPGTILPSTCNITVVGVCKVITCTLSTASVPSDNGGEVTISAPMIATTPMIADLGDAGFYVPQATFTRTVFMAADPITFHSSGSGIFPPIDGMVSAPSKVGLNTPSVPPSGILPIMRNQALHVEWDVVDSPATGTVAITMSAPSTMGDTTGTSAVCYFPVADGMGDVPAAVFMTFGAGTGHFAYSSFNEIVVPVGTLGQAILAAAEGGENAKVDFQ